ncbi:hypothetical protein HN415_07180 [Candidatus Woesearchaeota archaeon]|jgi:hypothetical protein|nr:hypothetical protein [Candidatus Woesearchaeota archaeon]
MKEYLTFEEQEFILKPHENKCQNYNLNIPNKPDFYGPSLTQIWVKQRSENSKELFQVLTNIHHKLSVFVPYPDKYVGINIKSENVNVNEPVQFTISAKNYGEKKVNKANARLDIYGADDYSNFVTSLYTNTKSIESMESVDYFTTFDTFGIVPGYYKAIVEFYYDNENTKKENIFRIGTLNVKINNYTKFATANKINPFVIAIESRWNNKIENLHARVEFEDINENTLTPTINLNPWQKTTIKSFIDLTGHTPGEYKGKITLLYDNITSSEDIILSVTQDIKEEMPEIALKQNDIIKEETNIKNLPLTSILLVIIIILIIVDIIYIVYKNKKNEK